MRKLMIEWLDANGVKYNKCQLINNDKMNIDDIIEHITYTAREQYIEILGKGIKLELVKIEYKK